MAEIAELLGKTVQIIPTEEMIWSKAYEMERERYEGADVTHLLAANVDRLALVDVSGLVIYFSIAAMVLQGTLL